MNKLDQPVSPTEETVEEGTRIKGKPIVTGPSREEYEEHMRTRIRFRNWCEFCIQGKSKSDHHRKNGENKEDPLGDKIATIAMITHSLDKGQKTDQKMEQS